MRLRNTDPPSASTAQVDHALPLPQVDRVDLLEERQRLAAAELLGARGERPDVLRQASAAEAHARVQEPPADPRVVADGVGERRDIRTGRIGDLGHRVDEADLRGEERVRRDLHELGGGVVGDDAGRARLDRRAVHVIEHGCRVLVARRRTRADRARACPSRRSPRAGTRGSRRARRAAPPRRGAPRAEPPCRPARCSCPPRGRRRPGAAAARRTRRRRTAGRRRSEPAAWGVPTARKCTSASAASAMSVLNRSRPLAVAEVRISGRPGSKNGGRPAASAAILRSSTSMPTTSWPSSAIAAACTAPR